MQEVTDFVNKNEIIKQVPLFSEVNWLESRQLLPRIFFFEYKKNEIIYQEGDTSAYFYLLVTGSLRVSKKRTSGVEKTLYYLTRNKYFGIVSLLTGELHSTTVRVVNNSFVLQIKKDDFDRILKRIPKLAVHMSKSLSRRLARKQLYPEDVYESKIISVLTAISRVGASMYATNLAISLKKETNKKVIFLDMNSHTSSTFKNLNISLEAPSLTLCKTSFNKKEIKADIITHESGIDLLCIDYNIQGKNECTNISYLLGILMEIYNYIVIDFPVSSDDIIQQVIGQSDLIHIVTDNKKYSLKSTRILIEELKSSIDEINDNLFVILNETDDQKSILTDIKIKKLLGNKIYAVLPYFGESLSEKDAFKGVLVNPDSKYSCVVRNISRRVGEVLVGLALSGGAALGFAHIGVFKVLEEEGIKIDVIVGTSMGAIIGGLWASGVSAKELGDIALTFRNRFKVINIFDINFSIRGLFSGRYVSKFLRKYLKVKDFSKLKIPFRALACDLESRQEVVFDEGSLEKAIRASASIPGIFAPLAVCGRYLIDGSVLQPLPVKHLIHMGVSKIIAVNVLPTQADTQRAYQRYQDKQERIRYKINKLNIIIRLSYWLKKKFLRIFFPNIFDSIILSMQASESVLAENSSKQADIYLHPDLSDIDWFEFYRSEELIERGEKEARRLLSQIKIVLGDVGKT